MHEWSLLIRKYEPLLVARRSLFVVRKGDKIFLFFLVLLVRYVRFWLIFREILTYLNVQLVVSRHSLVFSRLRPKRPALFLWWTGIMKIVSSESWILSRQLMPGRPAFVLNDYWLTRCASFNLRVIWVLRVQYSFWCSAEHLLYEKESFE